jgi:hypothetical protein
MITHNIVMSGGVKVTSCSPVRYIQQVYTKYFPRDILYNIHAARKGKMEKIVIKERLFANIKKTYGRLNVVYRDTFNALWNESDLIEYTEAYNLADAYFQKKIAQASELEDC